MDASEVEWDEAAAPDHLREAHARLTACTQQQFAEKVKTVVIRELHDMYMYRPSQSRPISTRYERHCMAFRKERLPELSRDYVSLLASCPWVSSTLLLAANQACVCRVSITETCHIVPATLMRTAPSLASYIQLAIEPFLCIRALVALGMEPAKAERLL